MRVVVLGYLVRGPLGGQTWHYLHYVLGLRSLGHDVYFVEDSDDYDSCYDPVQYLMTRDPSYGLDYAGRVFERYDLSDRWAYFDLHANDWRGPSARLAESWCRSADVVINVSGANPLRDWTSTAPARVLIDTDPTFTQVRNLVDPKARARAEAHTHWFTFGENVPTGASSVPDDGHAWRRTRQPIALDQWPVTPVPTGAPLTTVMQWDSYRPARDGRATYGLKSTSFPLVEDVPARAELPLEIALGSAHAPRDALREKGWLLRDPLRVSLDPWVYADYIRSSYGEFTVAKHGYVATNSGWFSERSACYMASGRPVITQETGFSEWMATGTGVLPFVDEESALDAIHRVASDPRSHGRAARSLAVEHFDARLVLAALLDQL